MSSFLILDISKYNKQGKHDINFLQVAEVEREKLLLKEQQQQQQQKEQQKNSPIVKPIPLILKKVGEVY